MSRQLKFNLWQYLDNFITQEDPIPDIRPANLYPSESSVEYHDGKGRKHVEGKCMRHAWLRIKTMESLAKTRDTRFTLSVNGQNEVIKAESYTPKTLWVFKAGDKFEQLVIEQMLNAGLLVCRHKKFFHPIRYGYAISGELDLVGRDPFTQDVFGIEVKSVHGFMAEKEIIGPKAVRIQGGKGKPKIDHVMQAAIYCFMWPELPYFKLMYIMRDKVFKTEFDITVDVNDGTIFIDGEPIKEFTIFDIFDRFATLAMHLNNGKLPARDYDLVYSDDKMNQLVKEKALSKTQCEAWTKYADREEEIAKTGKGRKLKKPVTGSWRCFAPNTLVRMANGGFKPIQEISIGDKVSGYDGPTTVTRVESKQGDKALRIKPRGMLDTTCTRDHKWLIAKWSSHRKRYTGEAFIPELVPASELVVLNHINPNQIAMISPVHDAYNPGRQLTKEQCRLLGYFTAEGNLGNSQRGTYYQVQFTIHPEEDEIAKDIITLGTKLFKCNYQDKIVHDTRPNQEEWTSRKIIFFSVKMANFIRTYIFGRQAYNKSLSPSIMGAPIEAIQEFLEAAELGDGYQDDNRRGISTSSRILCNQYQQLLWRLEIPAIAQYANKPKEVFGYKSRQGYRVQYEGEAGHAIRFFNIGNRRFALMGISSITHADILDTVWDIEVDSEYHVFATESGIASNCSYCEFSQFCYDNDGNNRDLELMGIS